MALHGRQAERDRLADLVAQVRAGGSGALLVRGEAGAGKSALLDTAANLAGDLQVLRATGLETEQELSYGTLHQLVRPALALLDRLPEPQAEALRVAFGLARAPVADRFLASVAALTLLAELAAERPVLCLVDDVQWSDPASRDAIVFVARRLQADGVAVVLAARDGERARLEDTGLATLVLEPLDAVAARGLLADRSGRPVADAVAERLTAQTGGNALALAEVVAELGADQLSGVAPLPDPLPLGGGIERAYAARVRRLSQPAQTAMLVGALQGDGPVAPVLRACAALGVGGDALQEAEARGLVAIDGSKLRFRHPLLRSAAHAGVSPAARRAAHAALADALADDPDRRAWHLAAAAVGPDPAVAAALSAVAERARERGASATASAALERAADLSADRGRRTRLLAQAAQDAWLGGNGARAGALIARARELRPDEAVAREIGRLQGTVDAWCGRPARGCQVLCEQARAVAGEQPLLALELLAEAAEAASFTCERALSAEVGEVAAGVGARDGEREPSGAVGEVAAGVGAPDGDRATEQLAALVRGTHLYARGRLGEAAAPLRRAVELGREIDEPVALNRAGRAAIYLGDEAASLALDRHAGRLAREAGAVFTLPSILVRTAIAELWLGRPAASAASAAEALRLAGATGQQDLVACALAVSAWAAAMRGGVEECRDVATQARDRAAGRGLRLFAQLAEGALAHVELAQGRHDEALALLERIDHPGVALRVVLDRVDAATQAGRADAAARGAALAREWADVSGIPAAEAIALHCGALVADPAEAEERFAAALACHETIDRPFERARTELALGEALRRGRRRAAARDHLRAALLGFEDIGAELWAERARGELRASGQTARRRVASTLDDLTPQEIQVGRLVAQGLTNREVAAQLFLSPRTIDFHLRNVFRKLGITTRTQLAHAGLGDPG